MERLQKYIASTGLCSRRKAEEFIQKGKIKVNGKVITELGFKVSENDIVEYNNKIIKKEEKLEYIIINKPLGYITTNDEQFDRPKVIDLIKTKNRLVSAGRLDMYTTGALIFSNDGEFINQITHPSNNITKTYNVTVRKRVSDSKIKELRDGVILDDGYKTRKAEVKILKYDEYKDLTRIQITLTEGKNRQVRRMFEAVNLDITALHRAKIGNIVINDLKRGEYRHLNSDEIKYLYNK